jgi:basic amino acid/polyamine antiporter, APA family
MVGSSLPVTKEQSTSGLVRTIGRWSLAALMVNTMIGASMAGLPSLIAAHLGRYSPAAYLIAAAGIGVVAACLAEVASQFREAGGPYLYARVAFGQFTAIQIGWLTWLTRIASASAIANLFITYLGEFFPRVNGAILRAAVLTLLIGFLVAVNFRGVSAGNWLSNFFTVTKLTLLVVFTGGGLAALFFNPHLRVSPAPISPTGADWLEAILLMIYAYGGFEAALFAAGETRNPRKDTPVALLAALTTTTIVYISVQYVVIRILPDAGASQMVAVDAARRFLGPFSVSLVTLGILVSAYGYLSANMLHTPRLTFAMGQSGDFPSFFGAIHPRFRTPHASIVIFAALVLLFSIGADFRWNAILGAVSRLFIYGCVAAALPVLRRKQPSADAFRLPGGMLFPGLALLFTGTLVTQMHLRELAVVAITVLLALLTWVRARRKRVLAR